MNLIVIIILVNVAALRNEKRIEIIYGNPNTHCACGKINEIIIIGTDGKIIGGMKSDPYKYPWVVQINYNGTFICGGSVINDRYILTAAHCWDKNLNIALLKVVTGSYNRCTPNVHTTIFSVSAVKVHKKYNPENFNSDIMLIKTNMKITFDKYVRPICLPKIGFESKYTPEVIGWGRVNELFEPSCELMEVKMPILNKDECDLLDFGYVRPSSVICAGQIQGGQDACQGDSGSPLQLRDDKVFYIIGIVSNGFGCAMALKAGYYTDVRQFISWIYQQTSDAAFCW